MSWTEERIERLKAMWTEGATASQIADELGGVSRNAVIGKAHRLGLEARPRRSSRARRRNAMRLPPLPLPRPSLRRPSAPRRARRGRTRAEQAAPAQPAHAAPAARPVRQHPVSLDRSRRLRPPGSRRPAGADPAGSAAPPGSGQAEPGSRRQDEPARSQRPHLQMADGSSGRARLPLLRQRVEPRLPLLRRALRRRLPGAASAPRPPPAAAAAVRRTARPLSLKRVREGALLGRQEAPQRRSRPRPRLVMRQRNVIFAVEQDELRPFDLRRQRLRADSTE